MHHSLQRDGELNTAGAWWGWVAEIKTLYRLYYVDNATTVIAYVHAYVSRLK